MIQQYINLTMIFMMFVLGILAVFILLYFAFKKIQKLINTSIKIAGKINQIMKNKKQDENRI
jgi:F0F1-type ATP synthase membrane subunit b/b'